MSGRCPLSPGDLNRSCGFNRCDDRQLLVPRRGAYSSAPVLNNLVRNIPTPTSDVRDLARRPTASNWALNFLTFSAVRDIFAVRTNRPRPCSAGCTGGLCHDRGQQEGSLLDRRHIGHHSRCFGCSVVGRRSDYSYGDTVTVSVLRPWGVSRPKLLS